MTNATLDRCNGKAVGAGGYAYFTTPDGGVACFVGRPGQATNRGLIVPHRRCPARGLRSAYCDRDPPTECPSLGVRECEKCEKAFFLFPACPKLDDNAVVMARVFGVIYLIVFLLLAARGPLLWVFQQVTGKEVSMYFQICRQSDRDWRPCFPDDLRKSSESEESLKQDFDPVDWLLEKLLRCAPRLLDFVRQSRLFMSARVMQAFRGLTLVCLSRWLFMLIDPWHVNELLPALFVGPLYGLAYPSLNWCFVQSVWLLALRTGSLSSRRPWVVKVQVITNIVEYVVQFTADIVRGFNVNPVDNSWLMMCQIYFITFGIFLSLSWFFVIPVIWRKMKGFYPQQQKHFKIELVLITLTSPFKIAHSIFSLLTVLPTNVCAGIAIWVQLMLKEMFIFAEFALLLLHTLITVYHASL